MRIELTGATREHFRAYRRARQTYVSRIFSTERGWVRTTGDHFEMLYQKVKDTLGLAIENPDARRMFIGHVPWIKARAMELNLANSRRKFERRRDDCPQMVATQIELEFQARERTIQDLRRKDADLDRRLIRDLRLTDDVARYEAWLEAKNNSA